VGTLINNRALRGAQKKEKGMTEGQRQRDSALQMAREKNAARQRRFQERQKSLNFTNVTVKIFDSAENRQRLRELVANLQE